MPYRLIFKYDNGNIGIMKSIACDNPKSKYGFEDRSIERKATKWARRLSQRFDYLECTVEHY